MTNIMESGYCARPSVYELHSTIPSDEHALSPVANAANTTAVQVQHNMIFVRMWKMGLSAGFYVPAAESDAIPRALGGCATQRDTG